MYFNLLANVRCGVECVDVRQPRAEPHAQLHIAQRTSDEAESQQLLGVGTHRSGCGSCRQCCSSTTVRCCILIDRINNSKHSRQHAPASLHAFRPSRHAALCSHRSIDHATALNCTALHWPRRRRAWRWPACTASRATAAACRVQRANTQRAPTNMLDDDEDWIDKAADIHWPG